MNVAMGVRTPAAALLEVGRAGSRRTLLSRFLDALKEITPPRSPSCDRKACTPPAVGSSMANWPV